MRAMLPHEMTLTWAVECVTNSSFFSWSKTRTVLPTIQGLGIVAFSCPVLLTSTACCTAFLEWTPVAIATID